MKECHNEWEITFEEIHRNGATFAIYNRYTGDYSYIPEKIRGFDWYCRFWHQRATFLRTKTICNFGVTGPNEYENNVNNNFTPTILQNGV
jgi:maltose phosphorylase